MQSYDLFLQLNEGSAIESKLREEQKKDIDYSLEKKGMVPFFKSLHKYTSTVPPLQYMPEEFQRELRRQIIDLDFDDDLNAAKVINWCKDVHKVFPVRTSADGNCLLHAVSQALWGINDQELVLRSLLYLSICNEQFSNRVKRRWFAHRKREEQQIARQINVDIPEQVYSNEWDNIKQMSGGRSSTTGMYPFLGAAHIYILANILRRPIIIYSQRVAANIGGEGLQENHLCGIYLPLEWDAAECYKYPIAIAFHLSHFAPLMFRVEMRRSDASFALPLVSHDLEPLIIHFLLPHEEKEVLSILQKYLVIREVNSRSLGNVTSVLCAETKHTKLPDEYNIMFSFVKYNEACYRASVQPGFQNYVQRAQSHTEVLRPFTENNKCVTNGCPLFGTTATRRMCSKCFQEHTKNTGQAPMNSFIDTQTATSNKLPSHNLGMNIQPEPSAPPPSVPVSVNYIDLSLMGEMCHNKCGLRCSTATYPYCHECHSKMVANTTVKSICKTPDCVNVSSPGQDGLCDECYNKKYNLQFMDTEAHEHVPFQITRPPTQIPCSSYSVLQHPSAKTARASDDRVLGQSQNTGNGMHIASQSQGSGKYIVCANPSCGELAQGTEINMCSKCFLNNPKQNMFSLSSTKSLASPESTTHSPLTSFPGMTRVDMIKGSMNNYSTPIPIAPSRSAQIVETVQPKTLPLEKKSIGTQTKYLCCIPGCHGIRLNCEDIDRCWACWSQAETRLSQLQSGASATGYQKEQRTVPPGSLSPLQGTSLIESTSSVPPSPRFHRCVFQQCDNLVDKPDMLCHSCQGILAQAKQPEALKLGQNTPVVPSGAPFKNTPIEIPELRGKKCRTPGCDRFGDASQDDLCSHCFSQTQRGKIPQTGPVYPFPSQHDVRATVTEQDPTAKNFKRMENQMKGKKCKTEECQNFGNSKSFGYCNKCYQDYLREATGKIVH